jgi:chorismate mutase
MDLEEIRKHLDVLDRKLLFVLAKRMDLIPKIAEYKKENNIARYQPEREKEIIKERRKLAKKLNLNPELTEDLFRCIIKDARRIEKEIMGE